MEHGSLLQAQVLRHAVEGAGGERTGPDWFLTLLGRHQPRYLRLGERAEVLGGPLGHQDPVPLNRLLDLLDDGVV